MLRSTWKLSVPEVFCGSSVSGLPESANWSTFPCTSVDPAAWAAGESATNSTAMSMPAIVWYLMVPS